MEIRFTLTQEDLWHLFTYASFKRRYRLWVFLLICYAIITLWSVLIYWPAFSLLELWPLWLLLIILAFMMLAWRRAIARGAGKGGEHIVRIMPEGIRERTDLGEGTRSWKTFKDITQDTHNFYFIVDAIALNAVAALVIPRRAFATPQDADTFLAQARQQWRQGREMTLAQAAEIRPTGEQET